MSSERLYYTDAYLFEFDAVVRDALHKGDRWEVTLDRTAFYPTSGGQPYDTGTLDEAQVVDVCEDEDGTIRHIVDRELEKNCRVRGLVDWRRRFDHMQQHTGQHLLSAAFEREVSARTLSFHLGASSSTIDLDKELSPDEISRVEEAANKVLWEDREVCVTFATASEAAQLPLRKDPVRSGDLRIVEIKDYDMSACGGTHVRQTGAIGVVAVAGAERFKGGMRVEFVCGQRALSAYRSLKSAVSGGVRLLSVIPVELPAAIEKLQTANRRQLKVQEDLQDRLVAYEAAALAARGEKVGAATIVTAAVAGWDAIGLKKLASAIVKGLATVAVVLSPDVPSLIVIARSPDLTLDAGEVLTTLIKRFGGKGGGKGPMAQGGSLTGEPKDILNAARDAVATAIA